MATGYKSTSIEVIEIDEDARILGGLRNVVDDWTLAFMLGFTGKGFWHCLINKAKLYRIMRQPKKSGGTRIIHDPLPAMRALHYSVRHHILLPLTELLGGQVTAYMKGKSTLDAARLHIEPCSVCDPYDVEHTCKYEVQNGKVRKIFECTACEQPPVHDCARRGVKVHIDLKNFFGSTYKGWIRQYFENIVGLNRYVSTLLAGALTVPFQDKDWEGVPQGSPCSGDICNLIADWRIDQPLMVKLRDTGWRYTRYADDLYFSHPENLSRTDVSKFLQMLREIIAQSGYRINHEKTQIQRPHKQQKMLGIVLNRKINMPRDSYLNLRALVNNITHTGFAAQMKRADCSTPQELLTWLKSVIQYNKRLSPHKAARLSLMVAEAEKRWQVEVTATDI